MTTRKLILIFVLGGLLFLTVPAFADAARFYFVPDSGSWQEGEKFSIDLRLDTEGVRVSSVRAVFQYATRFLKIEKVSGKKSIITDWKRDPDFIQPGNVGEVFFDGQIKNHFEGDGLIGTITMRGRKPANLNLIFSTKTDLSAPTKEERDVLSFTAEKAGFEIIPVPEGEKQKASNLFSRRNLIIAAVLIFLILFYVFRKKLKIPMP